jgi:hypothetical protein
MLFTTATDEHGEIVTLTPGLNAWTARVLHGNEWITDEYDHYDVLTMVDDVNAFAKCWRRELAFRRAFALELAGDLREYLERAEWAKAVRAAISIADLVSGQTVISDTVILAEILALTDSGAGSVVDFEARGGRLGQLWQRLVSLARRRHA